MQKKLLSTRGSITVWLTMLILVLMSMILVFIQVTDINAKKIKCKIASTTAIDSLAGEYDYNIYQNYNIFVYDSGYGEKNEDAQKIKDKLITYIYSAIDSSYTDEYVSKVSLSGCNTDKALLDNINFTFSECVKEKRTVLYTQAIEYAKLNYNQAELNSLVNAYGMNDVEKVMFVEYLLKHFSSCKNININDNLTKKKLFELEYIIAGKSFDNQNMFEVIELVNRLSDKGTSYYLYARAEYEGYIRRLLYNMDIEKLCHRAWVLIINNINDTFDKNIYVENCYCTINIDYSYTINNKITSIEFVKKMFGKKIDMYNLKGSIEYTYL